MTNNINFVDEPCNLKFENTENPLLILDIDDTFFDIDYSFLIKLETSIIVDGGRTKSL